MMTLGQKLKEIRKRFGMSQEQLAEILNVSRQAITKWENDGGLPDVSNLQEIAKTFGITVDYLSDDENQLPALSLRKELDKEKYKNKITMYQEVLKEYFPEPYEIFVLSRFKKQNFFELLINTFIAPEIAPVDTADALSDMSPYYSDMSPYYLVKKGEYKLLVNIKNYVLEIVELPVTTKDKRFVYGKNKFVNCGKYK